MNTLLVSIDSPEGTNHHYWRSEERVLKEFSADERVYLSIYPGSKSVLLHWWSCSSHDRLKTIQGCPNRLVLLHIIYVLTFGFCFDTYIGIQGQSRSNQQRRCRDFIRKLSFDIKSTFKVVVCLTGSTMSSLHLMSKPGSKWF